ncbi:TBC1 domain family member 15 [Bienertia sinuspersici]
MMFLRRSSQAELEAFYPIRPECKESVPKPRFKLRTGKTLSARRWHASFSEEGQLDVAKVLRRIQRGGVHPSIRGAVWEFLLGCYDPNSTFDDRSLIRQRRREQYDEWKAECQKMVPVVGSGKFLTTPIVTDDGQPIEITPGTHGDRQGNNDPVSAKKVIQWKQVLPQIGLDVVRTDQPLMFYQTESNQAKLWNILSIYAWVDSDISYVQGMNDICSPMVILLENEADAYWCFERAMRRLRDNFKTTSTSIGVQSRLSTLSAIIKVVDPKLHQHLEELDGGEYLFAFRMLMVLFRREFSFMDALYLWELMWAMEYNPNTFLLYETSAAAETTANVSEKLLRQYGKFERNNVRTGCKDYQSALAVFLAASILENKHKRILKEAKGLDDVVEILGGVTGNLDARKACKEALNIQKKFLKKAPQH